MSAPLSRRMRILYWIDGRYCAAHNAIYGAYYHYLAYRHNGHTRRRAGRLTWLSREYWD